MENENKELIINEAEAAAETVEAAEEAVAAPAAEPVAVAEPVVIAEPAVATAQPSKALSIVSMILGICATAFSWCYGIPSIIMGILACAFAGKQNKRGAKSGMTKTGKAFGIVGIILGVIFFIVWVAIFAFAINEGGVNYSYKF